MRIGLTGGIGSGKSTVAQMLRELGVPVVDADALVHAVQAPGGEAYAAIVAYFGDAVVQADGTLDRKAIARRVFTDPVARRALEDMVHPIVRRRLWAEADAHLAAGHPVVFLDIPLLIENGSYQQVDRVWLVWVDAETQFRRVMARGGIDEADARRRMAAQMPLDDKRAYAQVIIDNRGTLAETRAQVEQALRAEVARSRSAGSRGT